MNNQEHFIDAKRGFSKFMANVYAWMAIGVLLSASVVYLLLYTYTPIANAFWNLIISTDGMAIYGFIILELVLVFSFRFNPEKMKSPVNYALKFITYSIVNGITISVVLLAYTTASIFNAFISAFALFAVMSLIGFVTKKDLSSLGGILLSMLLGLIIASLVNVFFLQSGTADFILSIITVIIFVGLTAYDTQKCKTIYQQFGGTAAISSIAIGCALELYLDFINLFLSLLRIFGKRR